MQLEVTENLKEALLGDDMMSNWQFAGLTLTVLSAMFCGYKSLGVKAESPSTRVKGTVDGIKG
ncbi:TPA: hypothetical protein ACGR4O_004904 [Pseudomonas aeruginosa]|uniref:hypothetical protein n=1 Tax=Pseudomonas aeruginosa TaxID=287 RepID=UPI002330F8D7|nr:hypothetical protein [Pseudomonas aeruginosa]EMB2824004.1 hypothetical protein [Pseudomonas aeruginosa]HCF6453670.1 hypothetical protein [Pseudomonas aeruginosa]